MIKLSCIALALFAAPAFAGSPEQCSDPAPAPQQLKTHFEMQNGKRVIVIDPVITICGKRPEPSVAFVRGDASVHYTWETLSYDIMPLILSSVQKAPF